MTNDLSSIDPLAAVLDTAIEQENRVTGLLLEEVAQQARTDASFRQRLAKEPEQAIQEIAAKLPEADRKVIGEKQVARVAEVVRAGSSSVLPEIDVEKVQDLVFGTIGDARHSFKLSLRLTQVLFYSGLVMVAVAFIVMVLYQTDKVPSLIFGAVGVSGVVTSLVLNPLDRVQNAAGNLIQLEIAFLSYYKVLYLFNRPPRELSVKDAIKVSREIQTISEDVVASIEKYCEYRDDKSSKASADQPSLPG
jgi:hypothetical protein